MTRGTTCAGVAASMLWLLVGVHDGACASEQATPPAATEQACSQECLLETSA